MNQLFCIFRSEIKRRSRDSFLIGYNIIFPIIMILLLGYLSSKNYGGGFSGYQYYSIVIPPFCIAIAMITVAYAGKDDAYRKTAVRYLYAPVTSINIVMAKLLSCTVVISCCNFLVLIVSWLLFRLPVFRELLPVFLLLTSETFAICAVGLFIGLGMKNFIFIKNIINLPICAAAIMAGAFFPVGSLNTKWELIIKLSPLTWINRGLFLCIYDNNLALLWNTAGVSLLVGMIFTVLAVILFKKEEFIHGDLPGYEK
jgi:ABC-type multidrug transport system, permease component